MSESETQNPRPGDQSADSIPLDPLLDSGSFIDPDQPEPEQNDNVTFAPGTVIAAEPISMVSPEDISAASPKTPASTIRRNPEEMAKRPSWLPEDWTIDLRVRSNGATAGLIDRYYVAPLPSAKRFRSKVEVLRYLETGSTLKRKANSEADAEKPSASQKLKKSSGRRKKSEAINAENMHLPPCATAAVSTDTPQET